MPAKTPALISAIIVIVLLILVTVMLLFGQLLALNGFSEREGTISLVSSLICQGAGVILAAVLASRLTRLFIEKFNWHQALAVIVSVIAAALTGGLVMFIGLIISLFVAEGLHS